jgi:hypothetical protein
LRRSARLVDDHAPRGRVGVSLRGLTLGLLVAYAALANGCWYVTLYQPQKGIHRPIALERSPMTFAGLKVLVRCNASEDMSSDRASWMCGKIADDLERQGATVEWTTPSGARYVEQVTFDGARPDLTVEIESRRDHEYLNTMSCAASAVTCSLAPAVYEVTFSQRIVVFGKDRSVLAEETFRERFVNYWGCGVWSTNHVIDWLFRDDYDDIAGDDSDKRFSEAFYGQIRQMLLNARVRSEVLGLTTPLELRGVKPESLPGLDGAAPAAPGADGKKPAEAVKPAEDAKPAEPVAPPPPPPDELGDPAAGLPGLDDK